MAHSDTMWGSLEQWSPAAFLVAGGLFALLPVVSGLNALTGADIAVSPAAVFAFLLVVFAGLLGLYPRLAERDTGLAKGGLGLLAVTAAATVPAIAVFTLPVGLPGGKATGLAVVVTVAAGSALTVATFGVACLRTGTPARSVGGFLLVMVASVSFMTVVMLAYGYSAPEWVSVVVNGLVATSLGAAGYVLRTGDVPAEAAESTGDVAAS